jgi:dTDP-4-dehydrorhamnose reductase
MLGQALIREARRRSCEVIGAARRGADAECDLGDPDDCLRIISKTRWGLVINAAAITDLDLCEREPALAARINARAPGIFAWAAKRAGARFVHVSSDNFYTDGGRRPHREEEPVTLVNSYARSKFAGEQAALAEGSSLVLRTNITGLSGLGNRRTFANWAFDVAEGRLPATLFDDYFNSTIGVEAFSRLVFDLAATDIDGIVNLASRQVSSKREFVEALAQALGRPLAAVTPMSVSSLTVPRATSCGLDVGRAETILGRKLPGLGEVLNELITEREQSKWPTIA